MEEAFKKVVEQIFNNWTALQLAVEHSMAGPNSKSIALECLDYMTQFCLYDSGVNEESIQDALDDIMDQEFKTICEDGSTKEIAVIFNKFLELLKTGNSAQYEVEFNRLPTIGDWLVKSQMATPSTPDPVPAPIDETPENASSSDVPMEGQEDSSWTEVRPRRRR